MRLPRSFVLLLSGCLLAQAREARGERAVAISTSPPISAETGKRKPSPDEPKLELPEDETGTNIRGILPGVARRPPLHVEYVQYGVALVAETNLDAGAVCAPVGASTAPCILGGAGGIAIRGGYRTAGPWYIGGAYQFAKMDSSNLYRLGIFQQLRFEMRYLPDIGYRTAPYLSWGIGALAYGNEWGVETGGALLFGGIGVEIELSRVALLGMGLVYRPMLIAGWTDTAGAARETGLAQFLGVELQFEVRSEIGRK